MTLPADALKNAGLDEGTTIEIESSAEAVTLRRWGSSVLKKSIDRRSLVRMILKASAGSALAFVGNGAMIWQIKHEQSHDRQMELERLKRSEQDLLRRLFGIDVPNSGVALVPAAHHPRKPTNSFYKIENETADAYWDRFYGDTSNIRRVKSSPEFRDDDSLILFGSQVSNLEARKHLGDPWSPTPHFTARSRSSEWTAHLEWNLHTPSDAPIHEIIQHGTPWPSQDHRFISSHGTVFKSRYEPTQNEDYLLVTALPRGRRGSRRVIVFAGLHGAGTRSVVRLLAEPPVDDLLRLQRKTRGEPYYQALFHVGLATDAIGNVLPAKLELIHAVPLEVDFRHT